MGVTLKRKVLKVTLSGVPTERAFQITVFETSAKEPYCEKEPWMSVERSL